MSEALAHAETSLPAEQYHELLDQVEERILELGGWLQDIGEELEGYPLKHSFTPGLYIRQITMPPGAILTSKIHKTEHPFIVSKGRCRVLMEGCEFEEITAPHMGITQPGTRRMLLILEETVWTTFHPTELTDIAEIERMLTETRSDLSKRLEGESE